MSGMAQSVLTTAKRLQRKPQAAKTLTAAAMARAPFAEILASARGDALTVTHNGKPAAVLLSANRYRQMLRAMAALMEELEDREWAEEALRAKKEGFISQAESDKLMCKIRAATNKHKAR